MAPEQVDGRPADARTDLYALGATLHRCLAGRPPHEGENPASLLHRILVEPVPPVSSLAPGVPPALERIVSRLLEKDPAARYQSARELLAALGEDAPAPAPRRRQRGLVAAAAAAGLVLLAGGAAILVPRLRPEPEEAAPPAGSSRPTSRRSAPSSRAPRVRSSSPPWPGTRWWDMRGRSGWTATPPPRRSPAGISRA